MEILSGFLGALLGAGLSFLTLRYNYRDLYARNISSSRMEWINNFREEMSTVIAAIEFNGCCEIASTEKCDILYDAYKARAKLQTRLNLNISKYGNEYNQALYDLLNSIDFKNCKNSQKTVEQLLTLTRKILEPEWQRVKSEARGKKNDRTYR